MLFCFFVQMSAKFEAYIQTRTLMIIVCISRCMFVCVLRTPPHLQVVHYDPFKLIFGK